MFAYNLFIILLLLNIHIAFGRWRGNKYRNEDGILPYQRCNADQFYPGAVPILSEFYVHDVPHNILVSAVSTWGTSDQTGEPIGLNSIDILVYYNLKDKPCKNLFGHCCVNTTAKNVEEMPVVSCSNEKEKVQGIWNFSSIYIANKYTNVVNGEIYKMNHQKVFGGQTPFHPPSVAITCPFKKHNILTLDKFPVTLTFEDKFSQKKSTDVIIDVCYENVEELNDIVVCTEPLFGFSPNGTSPYWNGVPPYHNHNLLDSFLLYHINVHKGQNFHILPYLQPHLLYNCS